MKYMSLPFMASCLLAFSGATLAQQQYNPVPAGDYQFEECLTRSNKLYDGGYERSPIRGQNKSQAYCTCLWNETPDNFRGNLSKYADSERGKRIDKICTAYSGWD